MPRLTVTGPDGRERVFEFQEGPISIGRGEGSFVQLDDPESAPAHCQIEKTPDGRYKLVDLETPIGTEVNGRKVNAQLLEHSDLILIGDTYLVFEETGARAAKPGGGTRRIPILRRGRRARALVRRRQAPPDEITAQDLKVAIQSMVKAGGPGALDQAREVLERFYAEHRGAPFYEGLQAELENLYRMLEINKLLNSEHNLKKLLELIMDAVIEMASAERGFLILREGEGLVIKVARNFDRESIKKPEFKVSHGVAEEVLRTGKPVISADALNDPALPTAGSVADLKLRSLLCMPFRVRDRVLGCVYIDNRFETGLFRTEDLPLLQGFADQAATAIENARLWEENSLRTEELRRAKEEVERLNSELKDKVEKQYAELSKVREQLTASRNDVPLRHDFSSIIGQSRAMRDVFAVLDKVLDTNEPVYVYGESGTGKELVARAIHFNSPRAKAGKFVSENCSAIPDTLLESELFGHEKGSFTGAIATKMGLFELAHGGTLFLDEIGDMSVEMQKKVLRAIQEGEIRRVGGKDVIRVDVRIITASNKDLAELIKTGHFREDLFYRLNVVKVTLPPLRDRKDDVPVLVEYFLAGIARDAGQPARKVDEVAFWYLQNYAWPGNVRELENEVRRAVALSDGVITVDCLKEEIRQQQLFRPSFRIPEGGALKDVVKQAVEDVERRVIAKALEETGWKKAEAARALGISRPTLDAKIEQYGLTVGKRPV
ncbi:MAG TPA: sigma 54-interacting transcriptional regulator [Planctomycetota bacterium]